MKTTSLYVVVRLHVEHDDDANMEDVIDRVGGETDYNFTLNEPDIRINQTEWMDISTQYNG